MQKLKVLDLFSGIGGFSLGLEKTEGFETVAFCEIDPHAKKVLEKHWPKVPIFEDVKKLKATELGLVDMICGGFPCQDISVAGLQKGLEGARSGLWKEFERLIKEIKPRYVLIENVANLRSKGLNQVLKDLWKIGYDSEWHIISARSIGACHLRERVWIIAYPHDSGRGKQLRPISEEKEFSASELCGPRYSSKDFANSNNFRLWKPFTTEKAAQGWWAKATSGFRDWWEIESPICGVDAGLSRGLDKNRSQRIKQLGNTVVPQIPQLIGQAILDFERGLE